MGGGVALDAAGSANAALYKGRTTPAVIMISLVAACGGLLFGFDNGITGGVISHKGFASKFFPHTLQAPESASPWCKFDDHLLQLFTSCLFLAGAAAALGGSFTSRKYGRKATMTAAGACFLAGTVLVTAAVHVSMLIIGRLILGLGVGFATQATPLYLSEMAPANLRGALNIMFQLAVTIGILAAQLINYGTQYLQPWGWRLSLAMGAVPAVVVLVGSLVLPETPNSLIQRGRFDQGRKVLQRIRGVDDVDLEYDDIVDAAEESAKMQSAMRLIVGRGYRPQLAICVLVPIFQQFTGINAIMFYAPQLFESMGHSGSMALLSTVIIGAVNVLCTVVAIVMVDRAGRKALFVEGGIQMIIAEVIVGVLVYHTFMPQHADNEAMKSAAIAFICLFVAGFAWSWGPLGWLVPAEVNPIETRSAGCAINTFVNFITTFIIGQFFLSMLCTMQWGVFLFFAGMVLIATLFVVFFIPETKGVPIETLNEVSFAKHWFWKRTVHIHATRHSVHSVTGSVASATDAAALEDGALGALKGGSASPAKGAVL